MKIGVHDKWFLQQIDDGRIFLNSDYHVIRTSTGTRLDRYSKQGYLVIFLNDLTTKKLKSLPAHRLVWMVTNKSEIPEGMIINHIDGVKDNNQPYNLELSTHSENNAHAHRLGLNSSKGESNSRAYFTNSQVCEIRKYFATHDVTVKQMADKYGVIWMTMKLILSCKSYESVISGYEKMCQSKF